jgi:hypothetical protein
MTAIAVPTSPTTTTDTTDTTDTRPSLWKAGLAAGAVAAVATTAVAGIAHAAGVDLEVSGEAIPLAGFAQMTLLFTVVGVLIARTLRSRSAQPRSRWLAVTGALTALSFVPDLTAQADTGTKLVLMLTHVVAAAIVIPTIARRLPERRAV